MALTPIDFPDDPSTGDSFTAGNGVTYTWYNNRWNGKVNDVILTVPPEEIELNMLQDVCDDVPADGDVLTWDGTEWCGKEGPADGVSPVVTVGATNTLPAGSPANVTQAPTADGTELTFSIPKGDKGDPGTGIEFKGTIEGSGPPDFDGTDDGDMWVDADGNAWIWEGAWVDGGDFTGPPGTPGTQVSVGSTTTVGPSQPAAVTETTDGDNLQLNFFIPKGDKGDAGSVDNMPDGVVAETGHYENGDLKDGIKFGRGGGSDRTYEIDFAVRTDVTFNGTVDFDSRGTVTGLDLETLDNVTLSNPQPGDVLKHAGGGQWVNGTVSGGSGSDVDLTDYTKRNQNEIITKGWEWQLPLGENFIVRKSPDNDDGSYVELGRQGKVILNGGNEGNIFDTAITFFNNVTRAAWPFDVKLQLARVPFLKSDEYDEVYGLRAIGAGITFALNEEDPMGLVNITPLGIDIKRLKNTPARFGSIDFGEVDDLNSANDSFDVRMRMNDLDIGGGDVEKALFVQGNGIVVIPTQEDDGEKQGRIFITPKFLDVTREDGKPRIRFGRNELPGSVSQTFAQIFGNDPDLTINAGGGDILFVDKNGTTSLQSLRNSGGGGGGGTFPNAGYGLYYTGNTLNVDGTEFVSIDQVREIAREIAYDIISDFFDTDAVDVSESSGE